MGMVEVKDSISIIDLESMAKRMYGSLVKGVVDIEKGLLVLDAEMHVDEEQYLLEKGSKQSSLWGINLYPAKYGQEDFIEFDSMINIRPSANNFSRSIESQDIRERVIRIVANKVTND
jgi:hypothetical protein